MNRVRFINDTDLRGRRVEYGGATGYLALNTQVPFWL